MESRSLDQIHLHERTFRLGAEGRHNCRHEPVDWKLSGQPSRSTILLLLGARQDRSAPDHAMSFDLRLTNLRALVTGGTKGVGAAVVEVLRGRRKRTYDCSLATS